MASKPSFDTSEDIAEGNQSKHALPDNNITNQIKKIAKQMVNSKSKSKILDDDMLEKKINEVVDLWKPQFPTVALYVRWASHAKRDFNRDSISLLHTVADQSGVSPIIFLEQVKSYRFTPGGSGPYGLQFAFATVKKNGGNGVEKTYNKKVDGVIQGLKLTISYLEHQFATNGCAFGKAGMKRKSERVEVTHNKKTSIINRMVSEDLDFDLGGDVKFRSEALIKTHLSTTFVTRLWMEIEHRFLAFHVVKFIFGNAAMAYIADESFLEFSYRLLAPCRERYNFLDVLCNLCLMFADKDSVEVRKEEIRGFWDSRKGDNVAQRFIAYSRPSLTLCAEKNKCKAFNKLFGQFRLRASMNYSPEAVRQNPNSNLWWDCIRANCFRHYLDMPRCNLMKAQVAINKKKCTTAPPPAVGKSILVLDPDDTSPMDVSPKPSRPKPAFLLGSLSLDACLEKAKVVLLALASDDSRSTVIIENSSTTSPAVIDSTSKSVVTDNSTSVISHEQGVLLVSALLSLVQDSSKLESLRIATRQEIDDCLHSELVVKTEFGRYCLSLAPVEVYSASSLRKYYHQRTILRPPVPPPNANEVNICIGSGVTEFIDRNADILHVARPDSSVFHENKHLFQVNFSSLVECIILHGQPDFDRSPSSFRVNIGCGGLDWSPAGCPSELVGLTSFGEKCKNAEERKSLLLQVGRLSSFVWGCMQSFQRHARQPELATNECRKSYSRALKMALFIEDLEMEAESITLALMCVYPDSPANHEHLDTMNCLLYSYSKTGCLDVTLVDSSGQMYLLQVILNSRKVITHHKLPYYRAVASISSHIKSYLSIIQESYHQTFERQEMLSEMPTPFDKTGFFVDNSLPFESTNIGRNGDPPLCIDILLIPIGVSRTFSLSAANDVLMRLSGCLKSDQLIEMGLVVSLLNTPVRFNYIMNELIKRKERECWNFQTHPFYDWLEATIDLFGGWQGGPHQRWSPSKIPDLGLLFGGARAACNNKNQSGVSKEEGSDKLSKIVSILFEFVTWVDSLKGMDNAEDLPIPMIQLKMLATIKEVRGIADIGFGNFRLAVFLNVINACRLTKSGRHLRQLFFPVENTASHNHLRDPTGDMMSFEQARAMVQDKAMTTTDIQNFENDGKGRGVAVNDFDGAMRAILEEVGIAYYYRDLAECILCESMHSRCLGKREWLLRNCQLTDIDGDGRIIAKRPGKQSRWEVFQPKDRKHSFAFLKPHSSAGVGECVQNNTTLMCIANMHSTAGKVEYVHHDSTLMCIANMLGQELRNSEKVVFNGRETKTSNSVEHYSNSYATEVQLMPHQHSCANFFCGTHAKLTNLKNMNVLSSGEYPKDLHRCNDFRHYVGGRALFDHLHGVLRSPLSLEMLGACYHRGGDESNDQITYYQGHFDKAFVCSGWLIPLGESFFTFVSIPTAWHYQQDQRSLASYNQWVSTIKNEKERKKLEVFATAFKEDAKKAMNNVECKIYIFENKIGSLLAFPSNICYHTTVTPPSKVPRDLLIVHPLIGDKSF